MTVFATYMPSMANNGALRTYDITPEGAEEETLFIIRTKNFGYSEYVYGCEYSGPHRLTDEQVLKVCDRMGPLTDEAPACHFGGVVKKESDPVIVAKVYID